MVSAVHDGYVLQKVCYDINVLIFKGKCALHYLPVSNSDLPLFTLYISFESVINPTFSLKFDKIRCQVVSYGPWHT